MQAILNVALPIFGIVLAGTLAGRWRILGGEATTALNAFGRDLRRRHGLDPAGIAWIQEGRLGAAHPDAGREVAAFSVITVSALLACLRVS